MNRALMMIKRDDGESSSAGEKAAEAAQEEVDSFIHGLRRGAPAEERVAAGMQLAGWVSKAFGLEAAALGVALRKGKGLAYVLQLLYEGEAPLQRVGLMVLSNLVSDAFDPKSFETKRQVLSASVFERLKDYVYTKDTIAQTYACACLQNLCKDVEFARLLRSYELVQELETLVQVSKSEHIKRYAAGALFNTVEAVHREAEAASADAQIAAALAESEGRKPKKRTLLQSVMKTTEPEVELSEEVLEELAKREEERKDEETQRLEAVQIIQSLARARRTKKAFRMLKRLAAAVRVVTRALKRWQRRRRRYAALYVSMHFRSFLAERAGLCSYGAMMCAILGTRSSHRRACVRIVQTHFAMLRIEEKRAEAAKLLEMHNGRVQRKKRNRILFGQKKEAVGKAAALGAVAKPVAPAMPAVFRKASLIGARGAAIASGLLKLPRGYALPKPDAISSRIPLHHGPPAGGTPLRIGSTAGTPSGGGGGGAGAGGSSSTPGAGGAGWAAGSMSFEAAMAMSGGGADSDGADESRPERGYAPGELVPFSAVDGDGQPTLSPSELGTTPASMVGAPRGSVLGSSEAQLARRKSAAAAAKNVLTMSFIEDETAPIVGSGSTPNRKTFPPGTSAQRYQAFTANQSEGGSGGSRPSTPGSAVGGLAANAGAIRKAERVTKAYNDFHDQMSAFEGDEGAGAVPSGAGPSLRGSASYGALSPAAQRALSRSGDAGRAKPPGKSKLEPSALSSRFASMRVGVDGELDSSSLRR